MIRRLLSHFSAFDRLQGLPWGRTYPTRTPPPATPVEGRTYALRTLRQYVSELTFYRAGAFGGRSLPFKIPIEDFHIEWPDYEVDLKFPSISVLPARGDYTPIGLTAYLEEDSFNKYSPGTVVQWQSEYVENVILEIWTAKLPERRAVISGLEIALTPTEQMYGIRFVMPDYYNQTVRFTLNSVTRMDDPDSARNRRRARMEIEMAFNVVALVNVNPITPIVTIPDEGIGPDIELDL